MVPLYGPLWKNIALIYCTINVKSKANIIYALCWTNESPELRDLNFIAMRFNNILFPAISIQIPIRHPVGRDRFDSIHFQTQESKGNQFLNCEFRPTLQQTHVLALMQILEWPSARWLIVVCHSEGAIRRWPWSPCTSSSEALGSSTANDCLMCCAAALKMRTDAL